MMRELSWRKSRGLDCWDRMVWEGRLYLPECEPYCPVGNPGVVRCLYVNCSSKVSDSKKIVAQNP